VHLTPTTTSPKAIDLLVTGQRAWYVLNAADGTLRATLPIHGVPYLPVIDDGATYFPTADSGVAAINLLDGSSRWRYQFTDVGTSDDLLAAADGVLYAATRNTLGAAGALYALSTRDGHVLWHVSVTDPRARPAVVDGVVYLADQEDQQQAQQLLYAFRANDGSMLWHAQFTDGLLLQSPTVGEGVVYIATTSYASVGHIGVGSLYALRASDGHQLWQTSRVAGFYPAVANGSVYISLVDSAGVLNQHLVALAAATGDVRWQTSFDFALGATGLGLLYGASPSASAPLPVLTALDSDTGAIQWRSSLAPIRLTFANNVLYDAQNTGVDAVAPDTGSLLWHYQSDDVLSSVVAMG
jgi:outer membrane protein assembly factor BamB